MVQSAVLVMVSAGALMLALAAVLTVARMSRGPSSLDRVVAADVLVAVVIAALALEAVLNDHSTTLPVMLVLSLLGFAGSVSIARFVADRDKATRWNVADQPSTGSERRDPDRPDPRDRGVDAGLDGTGEAR
jgi:multicomponent Na+:H+ antiporter subunit F